VRLEPEEGPTRGKARQHAVPAQPSFRKARYGGSKIDEEVADLKKKLAVLEGRKAEIEGGITK
jgi:hypothetical protein